jgi:hypothetical protein
VFDMACRLHPHISVGCMLQNATFVDEGKAECAYLDQAHLLQLTDTTLVYRRFDYYFTMGSMASRRACHPIVDYWFFHKHKRSK